jgi:hypothetical protein
MWYPDAARPGEPNTEEEEEIRATMRERDEALVLKLEEKLKQVESESPQMVGPKGASPRSGESQAHGAYPTT